MAARLHGMSVRGFDVDRIQDFLGLSLLLRCGRRERLGRDDEALAIDIHDPERHALAWSQGKDGAQRKLPEPVALS